MPLVRRGPATVRAVIFDLDEVLLARAPAWAYTIEEAVISVTGRRVDAGALAAAYRQRPWRHALAVLLDDPRDVDDCAGLCREIYERSAMKRLLVQEGVGMALDVLRGASIESGAISREAHAVARRQVDSTGLDRFLAVLSATPTGEPWDAAARTGDCLRFLDHPPERTVFVSHDAHDLRQLDALGFVCFEGAWASEGESGFPRFDRPGGISALAG